MTTNYHEISNEGQNMLFMGNIIIIFKLAPKHHLICSCAYSARNKFELAGGRGVPLYGNYRINFIFGQSLSVHYFYFAAW